MPKKKPPPPQIGDRVRRNFEFLYKVYKNKSAKKRWEMVQNASHDELLAIIDICDNVTKQEFHITPAQAARIQKYGESMQKLGRVRSQKSALKIIQTGEGIVENIYAKRKRDKLKVVQKGGFLPAVMVPVLVELGAELLEKMMPSPSD